MNVPFIIGCNTDEGAGNIAGEIAPNTTEDMVEYLTESYSFDAGTVQDLAVLYPDIPQLGIPATYPGRPNSTWGLQFKRVAAAQTDLGQEGPRRYAAQKMARNGATVYTYLFNVLVCHLDSALACHAANRVYIRSTANHGRWDPSTSRKSHSYSTTWTGLAIHRTCFPIRSAAWKGPST